MLYNMDNNSQYFVILVNRPFKNCIREFPGGLVVGTLLSLPGTEFNNWSGTKILQARPHGLKSNQINKKIKSFLRVDHQSGLVMGG